VAVDAVEDMLDEAGFRSAIVATAVATILTAAGLEGAEGTG